LGPLTVNRKNSRARKRLKTNSCRRRWISRLLVGLVAVAAGCSLPQRPLPVQVVDPPRLRPAGPKEVNGVEQALAAIMTVCAEDLGFPRVDPLILHLYDNADAYSYHTDGLPRLRGDKIRLSLAAPHENSLHINLQAVGGRSWGDLLRLLAHEYGHNLEHTLTGRAQAPGRWIREGFADWIAAKVMDALGWESYSSSISRAEREMAHSAPLLRRPSELERTGEWLWALDRPKGRAVTHALTLIAVDRLVKKRGAAGMMDYFQSGNFSKSFGLAREDFERELDETAARLAAAHRPRRDVRQARNPQWKTGYRWQYLFTAAGIKGTVINQVTREETFEQSPSYVLTIGKNEYPHAKNSLRVLATLSGGKVTSKNVPPSQPLAWPLEVGKQWRNDYVAEEPEQRRAERIDTEVVVAAIEEIRVPAGTFEAFRVETYDAQTGELILEQWYAPRARWFVKSKIYREEGPLVQELVAYKLD
jgi:hypothetical protein